MRGLLFLSVLLLGQSALAGWNELVKSPLRVVYSHTDGVNAEVPILVVRREGDIVYLGSRQLEILKKTAVEILAEARTYFSDLPDFTSHLYLR